MTDDVRFVKSCLAAPVTASDPVVAGSTQSVGLGGAARSSPAATIVRSREHDEPEASSNFERQTSDADVVGDEPEPEAACMSGNEQIVAADRLASFLQVGTDQSRNQSKVTPTRTNTPLRSAFGSRRNS